MTPDTTVVSEPVDDDAEVMASVDTSETEDRLIIADVSVDDAWLSMPASGRTSLAGWR